MRYWSNAFLGLGVTLVAATVITFDMIGGIVGAGNLIAGYVFYKLSENNGE